MSDWQRVDVDAYAMDSWDVGQAGLESVSTREELAVEFPRCVLCSLDLGKTRTQKPAVRFLLAPPNMPCRGPFPSTEGRPGQDLIFIFIDLTAT